MKYVYASVLLYLSGEPLTEENLAVLLEAGWDDADDEVIERIATKVEDGYFQREIARSAAVAAPSRRGDGAS